MQGQWRFGFTLYISERHSLERFMSGEVALPADMKVPDQPESLDALWEEQSWKIKTVRSAKDF